jgi:hypothetical protein
VPISNVSGFARDVCVKRIKPSFGRILPWGRSRR